MRDDNLTYGDLVARAELLMATRPRVILGITGSPGAGKSFLAERLVATLSSRADSVEPGRIQVAYLPMDGFHLSSLELKRLGRLDRKGAPDTFDVEGYVAILERLGKQTPNVVYAPSFDRRIEEPVAGSIPIPPSVRLLVTEGNYLLLQMGLWVGLRSLLTEVWFCDTDDIRRRDQLARRHIQFGKSSEDAVWWAHNSDQENADLVAATRGSADLVIPESTLKGPLEIVS